ncbi:MAG: RDD family protein [Azoarcus sp.]|nr:RDD family protein [Azoarcus sp.]MDD2874067.1 RDD family protein [Azoarcus sp.]MDX9837343.1 RDD family protein [Azoarcus sp.]
MSRKGSKTPAAGSQTAAPGRSPTVVELAGLRRRLASMLYETMLLLGVLALTFMVPYLLLGMFFEITPPGWLAWIHIFLVLGFYFVWYWHRQGQTLAMQTWRLKIVDSVSGQPLNAARSWLRYVLAWPSVLIGGVGLIWAIFDRDRQFLHDRLSGSCVVLLPGQPKR